MDKTTESVWREMRLPLHRYIARQIHNEQDTEDVLQNIFCKIHGNIAALRDDERIHAWVFQITRNALIDFYRTHRKSAILSDIPEEAAFYAEFESELSEELGSCIRTIVNNMPEKYRSAIVMTEFEEISQKALAERLGLSLSGAKSRVQRGRAKLRELLLGCCHVDFDRRGNIIDYRRKRASCKYC